MSRTVQKVKYIERKLLYMGKIFGTANPVSYKKDGKDRKTPCVGTQGA